MTPVSHRSMLIALIEDIPRRVKFVQLVTPITDLSGMRDAEHLNIELRFGASRFHVIHSNLPALQTVATIECELGAVPKDDPATVYQQLLKLNQRWAAIQPTGFGLDIQRNTLVFSSLLDIANANSQTLIDKLQAGGRLALMLQTSRLLDMPVGSVVSPAHQAPHALHVSA